MFSQPLGRAEQRHLDTGIHGDVDKGRDASRMSFAKGTTVQPSTTESNIFVERLGARSSTRKLIPTPTTLCERPASFYDGLLPEIA